jgi:hypothetical protein
MSGLNDAHALVVGIANYDAQPLPRVVLQDALDIHDVLLDRALCGYPPGNVRLLLDDQATKAAMVAGLGELASRATSDSTVFIYVSGHGGRLVVGDQAEEFIWPRDVNVSVSPFVKATALSGEEFSAALAAIKAPRMVVVLDVCHAGGIGLPKAAGTPVLRPGNSEKFYAGLARGRGRVILAACKENEYSRIMPGAKNSLFTEHILAGLRGGVTSEDEYINIFELIAYVQPRVTQAHPEQHPYFELGIENDFPIALFRGGKKRSPSKKRKKRSAKDDRLDAFISYSPREPDTTWVWDTLIPRLRQAKLKVAVAHQSEDPAVPLIVSHAQGVESAKRTIAVLSENYLNDHLATFTEIASVHAGVEAAEWRLVPIRIGPVNQKKLDLRLRMLPQVDVTGPQAAERLEWLVAALQKPVTAMSRG